MKKMYAVSKVLILSILVTFLIQTTSLAKEFSDVSSNHWAYQAIKQMSLDGVITGNPDGKFDPNGQVTRSQFAKISVGAFKLDLKTQEAPTFADMKKTDWDYAYVETAKKYLTGFKLSDGTLHYKGAMPAVREDMAVAIVKVKGFEGQTPNYEVLSQFADSSEISEALKKYVAIAVEKGIMKGDGKKFNPKGNLTRAEAAMLIYNASYASMDGTKVVVDDTNTTTDEVSTTPSTTTQTSNLPIEKDITINRYKVTYMKTSDPSTVVASDTVEKVSLNFIYDFKGIAAQDFSAKWVGYLDFASDTKKTINISNSWSDVKLKINNVEVTAKTYTFKKGLNKVEVSYVNHWHTVNFTVNFQDEGNTYSLDKAKETLSSLVTDNTTIEYVGVYESKDQANKINLLLTQSQGDVILFLGSYEAVNWVIDSTSSAKIKAIVYNSYDEGTEVNYTKTEVPIFRYKALQYAYTSAEVMSKVNGVIIELIGRGADDSKGNYSTDNFKIVVPSRN